MIDFLKDLNEVQVSAVQQIDGPVIVIAGPGSGKTRVLTYRLAYMIESGINPQQILSLTFTNKAAKEMTERIEKVAGEKARKVWSGTFHSIFARILRVEATKLGYPANFTIYDTEDSKSLINEIVKSMNLNPRDYNINTLRNRISNAKSNLVTPLMYEKDNVLIDQDRQNKMPATSEIYKKYMSRCHASGAMDFDDLLLQLFRLFQENPDNVLEKYRNFFKYLMVDEFQDTNFLQYAIVKKLTLYNGSSRNVCIVGDDAQSIYSFRGATIKNILDFEADFPDVKTFKLEQNYRSTDHIVQAANDVITHNKRQIKKEIWTDRKEGQKIKLLRCASDSEEGRRVSDYIVELKNRHHLRNSEIGILYRTNAQSRIFEENLRRLNIPYKVFGGLSFYQRKEVKDLLAYLRLVINPKDNEAFKRIINYPKRGIGDTSIDKIIQIATSLNISYFEAIPHSQASGKLAQSLHSFYQLIKDTARMSVSGSAYDAAMHIFKSSGLSAELKQDLTQEGLSRLENVLSLLDGIKEFIEQDEVGEVNTEEKTLSSYIQSIALITELDEVEEGQEFISLMSIHSAKGLEFDAVMVAGLEENLFPSFLSMSEPEQMDEERRLFYVAITRARQFLCLSYATSRYQFGNLRMNEPSRFLEEINQSRFEMDITPRASIMNLWDDEPVTTKTKFIPKKPSYKENSHPVSPSDPKLIASGMKVMHQKFGLGKVINVEGSSDNRIATIFFKDIEEPNRKIMLKFAKLEILP
ncbi:MAG: UvrD-helicase domain-containing protein [Saprospiraceae bacterium]|nr:UvrD-helicase domain-containing protein [Saprospiraceae bacterium]